MEENIIECRNLTHYYGSRMIYENLSFSVPRGRILGLLGKNGTGKTTTINILSGYLQPRSGECLIFGEDIQRMDPLTRRRIALLIEGHVQYAFMTVEEIERYYSAFYPAWNREAYYELIRKLKIAPKQRIARMSCGQRSQVALGLILAQNAELLVLDDFSMGLDPGYRRLFIEYLREYAKAEAGAPETLPVDGKLYHSAVIRGSGETYSFADETYVGGWLTRSGIAYSDLKSEKMNLEDAFIGLTGKY